VGGQQFAQCVACHDGVGNLVEASPRLQLPLSFSVIVAGAFIGIQWKSCDITGNNADTLPPRSVFHRSVRVDANSRIGSGTTQCLDEPIRWVGVGGVVHTG
jgi:hypothetical protein